MPSGNLKDFGTVTVRQDKVEVSNYVTWAKAHIVHLIAVLSTVVAILTSVNSALDKYVPTVDNPPAVVKPVDKEPENKLRSMDVNPEKAYKEAVENNVIHEKPQGNRLASRFSGAGISAALIVPDKAVDVYKFVKIKTDKEASFYDLMVMTVYKNNIVFVDTVPTANKGEWVFTGPPGQYAVRLSSYNPTTGVNVDTGNVIIGEPAPPPPPPVAKVAVPNFVGNQFGDSQSLAVAMGLILKADNPDLKGVVTSQDIAAKTSVDVGSTVNVVVKSSTPPPPPPPPVFTEKYGFSTFAFTEVMTKVDADSRKAYKDGLASNFEAVAASIAAGAFTDVKSSQVELAGRNRLTLNNNDAATVQKWMTFFTDWSAKATDLNKNGTLPNMLDEYRLVYLETAKGLRAAQ